MRHFEKIYNEFSPKCCLACGSRLEFFESIICLKCKLDIPKTGFLAQIENPVSELFWGRVYLQQAASVFYFQKKSRLQSMLHALKYRSKPEMGHLLGEMVAEEMQQNLNWRHFDAIVPVPLHPDKQRIRGYNQAEEIAKGIQKKLSISISTDLVYRKKFTESQTRKTKIERWQNMQSVFGLNEKANQFENKHLLIIDDVLTTGATIEATANVLSQIKDVKLSVLTVAFAKD